MKEEALKLAEQLEDDAKYGECDWTNPKVSATMIRRLVEELDKWENPLYRSLPVIREKINSKPIAWLHKPSGMIFDSIVEAVKKDELAPLYTAPQTKPLSDEEIMKLWGADCTNVWASYLIEFAKAIEERHGIK